MKVLISPAKSLNFDKVDESKISTSLPQFPKESRQLINKLKRTSKTQLRSLMSISKDLADLNKDRYESFSDEFTIENSKPAILAFNGDVYLGMEANNFDSSELAFANQHIRILSGLYGLLKPLDRIQPYRLEMGTRLKVGRNNNLVNFWKEKLTKNLNQEMKSSGDQTIINLASNEYFNALDTKKINANIINCSFKEDHGGQLKFISFNAKKARGMMCKFIVEHKITDPELIKGFDIAGYHYETTLSEPNKLMFIR